MQLLWMGMLLAEAQQACLPNAVPPQDRRNLVNTDGEQYPLGVWVPDWSAAKVTSAIMEILVMEKLGYNISKGEGAGTPDQFFAMTGCTTPTDVADRGCGDGPTRTYYHLSVEGWTWNYGGLWTQIQENYPATAPRILGSSGYMGVAGQFVASDVVDAAIQTEGLALEFYRGYNVSWHNPSQYFDQIGSLNANFTSYLARCNETRLQASDAMLQYAVITGDWDGIENISGVVRGKCVDDHFWHPPVCRQNASACFIFITGGAGWELEHAMQKATTYNMPLVPVVAQNYATYGILPKQVVGLFYWWQPDPTFLSLNAKQVHYPLLEDREARKRGDLRAQDPAVGIDKYGSHDLFELAPEVEELVKAYVIDLKVVNDLLLDQINMQSSANEAACRWLLANTNSWENWLPDSTRCFPQFGLYNQRSLQFVDNRTQDVADLTCMACTSGFFSVPLRDREGLTYICQPCPPGSAQPSGASSQCEPCGFGEYQDVAGGSSCKRCEKGTYQDGKGQSSCTPCPNRKTTLALGAVSVTDCVCEAASIDDDGLCKSCSLGMSCPKGSSVALLLNHTAEYLDEYPVLLPGYSSGRSFPLKVYKCQSHCPGGMPGSCLHGRGGLTCGTCPTGTFVSIDGSCANCEEEVLTLYAVCALMIGAVFMIGSYYASSKPYTPKARSHSVAICIIGLAFNTLQNLTVVSTARTVWPSILLDIVRSFRVFTLNMEAFGLSCFFVELSSAVHQILFQASLFPAVVAMIGLTSILTRPLPAHLQVHGRPLGSLAWTWYGTVNLVGKFLRLTFPTMVNVGFSPFMCYTHPGGEESLLKYTDIFCGSEAHLTTQIAGGILLCFCIAFLAFSCAAAWNVAAWSLERQAACKFMIEDFRPDRPWFGLITLCRGLLLSMPAVIAPNSPTLQLLLLHAVMLASLFFQCFFHPWKAPAVNLLDAFTQCLFISLIGVGLGGLVIRSETADADALVLDQVGSIVSIVLIGVFFSALFIFLIAMFLEKVLGMFTFSKRCINLGDVPNPNVLFFYLKGLAQSVENSRNEKHLVLDAMGSLGTYDARIVLMALAILQVEVGLKSDEARSRNSMESHFSMHSASSLSQLSEKARRVFAGQSDLTKRRVTERLARGMASQVVSDIGTFEGSEMSSEVGSVFKAEKSDDNNEGGKLEDGDDDHDDPIIVFSS